MKKVVLDTSFLITLTDRARTNHATACKYWEHFLGEGMHMFIPTIVVSEYTVKGPIPEYVFNQCILAPFNHADATFAGEIGSLLMQQRPPATPRVCLKDDLKIIAQAMVMSAEWVISDDPGTFHVYVQKAATLKHSRLRSIVLEDGFSDAGQKKGQRDLSFTV